MSGDEPTKHRDGCPGLPCLCVHYEKMAKYAECPAWEDGRHCFVPTVDSRTALARGGFDGPPTHKACACGAEIGRRK